MKLKELTWKQLKELRKSLWNEQNKKCAILRTKLKYEDATLDHQHKKKGEVIGKNGAGLVRGVLDFRVNSFEGKVNYWYKRLGLDKLIELPKLLRNLADYLEKPALNYVHPSERKKKATKLGKREYNKLCKYYFKIYPNRKKLPKFPKSGKRTKEFESMLKDLKKYLEKG